MCLAHHSVHVLIAKVLGILKGEGLKPLNDKRQRSAKLLVQTTHGTNINNIEDQLDATITIY